MSDVVQELIAAQAKILKAHDVLQECEAGLITSQRFLSAVIRYGLLFGEKVLPSWLEITANPGPLWTNWAITVAGRHFPSADFKYAQSYDYVSVAPGRRVGKTLWHVTAHENANFKTIHATGTGVNSNKALATMLAAVRLYDAVVSKRIGAAATASRRAGMGVGEKLRDLMQAKSRHPRAGDTVNVSVLRGAELDKHIIDTLTKKKTWIAYDELADIPSDYWMSALRYAGSYSGPRFHSGGKYVPQHVERAKRNAAAVERIGAAWDKHKVKPPRWVGQAAIDWPSYAAADKDDIDRCEYVSVQGRVFRRGQASDGSWTYYEQ